MTLRPGTQDGPATARDHAGIVSGILAPLSIVVLVIAGGLWINHDDRYAGPQDGATSILDRLDEDSIRGKETVRRAVFERDVDLEQLNVDIAKLDCKSRFQPVAAAMWDIVDPEDALPAVAVDAAAPPGEMCDAGFGERSSDPKGADSDDSANGDADRASAAESDVDVQRLRVLTERAEDDATFSHLHDMMSDLGDRDDAIGVWFLVVNVAVGLFLLLFAVAVFRRVPVSRWVVLLLVVTAILSATLGLSRCQLSCDLTEVQISHRFAHRVAAVALLILIIVIPALAKLDLERARRHDPDGGPRYLRWLETATRWLPQLATLTAIATLVAVWAESYAGLFQRLTWAIGYAFVIATSVAMWLNRRGFRWATFDVTRVQENVLYGSTTRIHGRHLIGSLEPGSVALFKRQMRSALDERFIRAEMHRPLPALAATRDFTVTVGFTKQGLDKLEVPYRWTSTDVDAFGAGMRHREDLLGDAACDGFDPLWKREPDVVFWVTGETAETVDATADEVRARFDGCVAFRSLPALSMEDRVLGFADGLSNPWIVDVHPQHDPRRQGGGKLNSDGGWERLALGEFVIGQIDETRDVYPVPEPESVFDAGTFLVLQQLEIDVDQFDALATAGVEADSAVAATRTTRDEASTRTMSKAEVEAKMMGRTRDGVALAASLDGASGWKNNSFVYGHDPEGFECPLGAHARRANPRDSLGFDGVPAHRRRIIRRGMPYRIEQDRKSDHPGLICRILRRATSWGIAGEGGEPNKQGLMFAAFNVRIADQFEFIQRQWLDDGDAFRLGNAPDPIAGRLRTDRSASFTWNADDGPRRIKLDPTAPVTRCVGGAYFLVPSIAGLQAIATEFS